MQGVAPTDRSIGRVGLPKATPEPARYDTAAGAEGVLLKTGDGLTLFGQWWKPDGTEPRAAILLVHGTIAHSGFYASWVNQLTAHGYAARPPWKTRCRNSPSETKPPGLFTPAATARRDVQQSRVTSSRTSVISAIALATPSRPIPESFTPP